MPSLSNVEEPVFGFAPDLSVSESLLLVKDILNASTVAVVRSIDSTHNPENLAMIFEFHGIPYHVNRRNVLLIFRDLWMAIDEEMFSGFDEVWLYETDPVISLESVSGATSDGIDFTEEVPESIKKAFDSSSCLLLLGDGCGLNYATIDPRIRERLAGAIGESLV